MKGYQGLALGCLLLPVAAFAQVPVVEGGSGNTGHYPRQQSQATPDIRSAATGISAEGQLMQQMYQMQQEVSMLRGLLEEQEYRLKKLERDQLERYQDLDRRLSTLLSDPSPSANADGSAAEGLPPVIPAAPEQADNNAQPAEPADPEREKLFYDAAFEQVRLRDFDKAVTAFTAFLRRYPQSDYAGNAQYWLGEVHLAQTDLEAAGEAFARVISQYPGHRKEADSLYKLADVERRLGNLDKATELYQEVLSKHPNASAAQLARRDLNTL